MTSSLLIPPSGAGRLRGVETPLGRLQRLLRTGGPDPLPDAITQVTWQRFFDAYEPVHALVAERDGQLVGLTHYLFHRSTTRIEPTCYLQDLFTLSSERGQGVGRKLIEGVYAHAQRAGGHRVYWQTHVTNTAGRTLYDKVAEHSGFIVYATTV